MYAPIIGLQVQTGVVLLTLQNLLIITFYKGSLFRIIFQSKYSLIKSNSANASICMSVVRPCGNGTDHNSKHISQHLLSGGEGIKVQVYKMVIQIA